MHSPLIGELAADSTRFMDGTVSTVTALVPVGQPGLKGFWRSGTRRR